MSIQVTPLSEALGAEITGVDLAQEQGPHGFDIINRAWLRHKVILFRGHDIGPNGQLRFALLFGEFQAVRSATQPIGENQFVMHARTDFDAAEGRVLRRVAVKCPRPLGVDGRG